MDLVLLKKSANEIRKSIIKMVSAANSGHPGGSLSIADILSVLYFHEMNIDPKNPKMANRDRLILSKGHASPGIYGALAEKGYFSKDLLTTFRSYGSILQGHPDMKKVPGVDMSTGSLGQGLSVANGIALSERVSEENYRTYVIMGDGEIQEGQVWEAAMTSAHYKIDTICAILDNNNLQIDGNCDKIKGIEPLDKKWESFGWNVIHIDGHNMESIISGLNAARECKGKPTILIAKTIKGKGVSFMEGVCGFHGVAPNKEETIKALEELNKNN